MRISFSLCLPSDEASVPIVRHLLGGALRKLAVSEACVSDIEVAISEASTNVLKQAEDAEGEYEVLVQITDGECEIRITDTGRGFDHASLASEPRRGAEGGRGIRLMQALVDKVDFKSRPEAGTVVCLVKDLEVDRGSPLGRLQAVAH